MNQRWTRLKDAPSKPMSEDASDAEGEMDGVADKPVVREHLPTRATKPRPRKRKVAEEPDAGPSSIPLQPLAKKARKKRGILKELVEMPMDVLLEVCKYLS